MGFRDIIKQPKTKKDKVNCKTDDTTSVLARETGTGYSISAQNQTGPPTQEAMDKCDGARRGGGLRCITSYEGAQLYICVCVQKVW
jgi:hypothetical protein